MNLEKRAKEAAGNWQKFESFAWFERPEDEENWAICYVLHRDSELVAQSNAATIAGMMEPYLQDGTAIYQRHNHWAVGWVEGYVIRVYAADGSITPAFTLWAELEDRIDDYPLLDEEDHSSRELEATMENIESNAGRWTVDNPPDGWAGDVYRWLGDNGYDSELDPSDGGGAWPSDDSLKAALAGLGILDAEYAPVA